MGRLTTVDLRFIISYNHQDSQSKRLLAARLHFWKEGSEVRFETHSYSARFYRSGMNMLFQRLEVDEWNNIILEARMDNDQVRIARERASKLMQCNDTTDIIIYPDMDSTGYITISRQFAAKGISRSLAAEKQSYQRKMLEIS